MQGVSAFHIIDFCSQIDLKVKISPASESHIATVHGTAQVMMEVVSRQFGLVLLGTTWRSFRSVASPGCRLLRWSHMLAEVTPA